jgi:pimeloyl-ACP methyl ester carboxylesterase
METAMKFNLENGFLAYNFTGEGIPLLFIHGYPLSRRIWDPQVEALSKIATIITVDLRGHGDSAPFEGSYSMNLLADDCQRLLAYLDIKSPVIVCGLSMGGYITFAFYRKYPGLFKGMILTSTRAGSDSPEGKANRDLGTKNALEYGAPFIADGMVTKAVSPVTLATKPALVKNIREIMAGTSVQGITGALQGMKDRPDSTSLLAEIKCPVLIIHGAEDQLIPIGEAESMKQKIPNSQLVIIPGAGHLVNMEQPEKYNKAVADFILGLD